MNDRCVLATYFLSPLSKINNPEHASQFKLIKYPQWNRINDLLISKKTPVTLLNKLFNFRKTYEKIELQGDLLKMITNKKYNVYLAKLSDRKVMFNFAKEMCFDEEAFGKKIRGLNH